MFGRLKSPEEIFSFKLGSALTMEHGTLAMLGGLEEAAQAMLGGLEEAAQRPELKTHVA